jgi:hypothetical protein
MMGISVLSGGSSRLRAPGFPACRRPLPIMHLNVLYITEGIKEIVVKWNKQKIPFKKHKAFKIWSKSALYF